MSRIDPIDIKVGDRVQFRAACRTHDRKVWRVCTGHDHGRVTVRYNGWPNFIVRTWEISGHNPKVEVTS